MFMYFDVKVYFLTYGTSTAMTFTLKTAQTMTTNLGPSQYNFGTLVRPHA